MTEKEKLAFEMIKTAKELVSGVGYELYAKGADRIAHQTKTIKDLAEKLAKATRDNKSLKVRKKLVKDLEKWLNVSMGELKELKSDVDNLEGYK